MTAALEAVAKIIARGGCEICDGLLTVPERHAAWGCEYLACPDCYGGATAILQEALPLITAEEVPHLTKELDEARAKLAEAHANLASIRSSVHHILKLSDGTS